LRNDKKKELRERYKELRKNIQETEVESLSLEIANRLLSLPIWEKNYFHIFLPMVNQNEVNTEFIMHILSGKDKEIIVSKSDFVTGEMKHFLLTDNTKLMANAYGIPEPVDGIEIPVEKIDVIVVPLLAFDLQGNRVGYGKGFYDRFLAECRNDVVKIGVSFFEAEELCGDVYPTDVKLDYCVTPYTVYKF